MQRPATIRHRTSLFEDATAIVEAEFAADLSLDDIARRVASSRRQLQRAYAEIGHTTFREHLTRGAHGARRRAADDPRPDGPRGRTSGRLPPARPVREGVPAPSRRGAVGVPLPTHALQARTDRRRCVCRGRLAPLRRQAGPRPRTTHGVVRRLGCVFSRAHGGGGATREGARTRSPEEVRPKGQASIAQMIIIGVDRIGARHRARAGHRLVPDARVDPGREDRHALRRPDHRLGAGVRPRDGRRPLLRVEVPHAPGRGARGRAADPRQHAPRGHLDRDPRVDPRRALHLRVRRR